MTLIALACDLVELGEAQHAHRLSFGIGGSDGPADRGERRVWPRHEDGETPGVGLGKQGLCEAWSQAIVADGDAGKPGVVEPGDEVSLLLRSVGNAQADGHEQFMRSEPLIGVRHLARVGPQHGSVESVTSAHQACVERGITDQIGDCEGLPHISPFVWRMSRL